MDIATIQNDNWEQLEDDFNLADSKLNGTGGGGGGGRGSTKPKVRKPNNLTSKSARSIGRINAIDNRKSFARVRINEILQNLLKNTNDLDRHILIENYLHFIKSNWYIRLAKDIHIKAETQLNLDFFRSGKKAGGQNVNKVNSGVRITHLPTNIAVRNETTRDQIKNREKAEEILRSKLFTHINDWKTFVGLNSVNDLTTDLIINLLI